MTSLAAARGSRGSFVVYFVGVTTGQSTIMTLFPKWVAHLGLDARIVGIDLPLGASPQAVRDTLGVIATDSDAVGALITSHKAAVYDEARDLFTDLDHFAQVCREISCVTVRDATLRGWAKDAVTAGQAMDWMRSLRPEAGPYRHVLCFGAGGAGIAISVRLLTSQDPPERLVLVDRDPRRIEVARYIHSRLDSATSVEYLVIDDADTNDELLSTMPPETLVINGTGMGKDLPGAPISDAARFPESAVAWDLNYRGELAFLRIADAQADALGLLTVDGWRYFLHGWTEVIAEVFDLQMTEQLFAELEAIAQDIGGRAPRSSQEGERGIRL